ncbi:MAG: hypothetical protein AB8F78_18010, partial [Saprospiraceae bacterium]
TSDLGSLQTPLRLTRQHNQLAVRGLAPPRKPVIFITGGAHSGHTQWPRRPYALNGHTTFAQKVGQAASHAPNPKT